MSKNKKLIIERGESLSVLKRNLAAIEAKINEIFAVLDLEKRKKEEVGALEKRVANLEALMGTEVPVIREIQEEQEKLGELNEELVKKIKNFFD